MDNTRSFDDTRARHAVGLIDRVFGVIGVDVSVARIYGSSRLRRSDSIQRQISMR